ncbi:MAG: hypothetical protein K2X01_08495 [Cyanobacteria bacterium]|nr:hypothetical protein [Cyanobacteriota bacterium]
MTTQAFTSPRPQKSLEERQALAKKQALLAWGLAVFVFLTFMSVCAVAVVTTMNIEANKPGFKAIEVSQPISFLDNTYLKKAPAKP